MHTEYDRTVSKAAAWQSLVHVERGADYTSETIYLRK